MSDYTPSGQIALWAAINTSGTGDKQIVAAVPGMIIRVISGTLTAGAATNLGWKSAGNVILGAMPLGGAGAGFDFDRGKSGGWLMQTNAGEALNINSSVNTVIVGSLNYVLVVP